MDIDFNSIEDIDIGKEGITRKKFNKYIIIVPTISIFVSLIIIIISLYKLITGDYKKNNKEDKENKEIIINCIEGDDDYCKKCENDTCIDCNYRYDLINGTCIPNFSFKVIYETTENNKSIKLINNGYQEGILDLALDKEIIDIDKIIDYEFKLLNKGNHTAYFSYNSSLLNGESPQFFPDDENIIYLYFTKNFNTENITQISLFRNLKKVTYIDISNFNIKKLTNMDNLFYECNSLTAVKLPNSVAPNLNSVNYMFYNCYNLVSINFSKLLNYSSEKLIDFESMFSGCNSLKTVDFSNFKGININNTKYMFNNCTSLTSLNLSNFVTNNLNMDYMFNNCSNLNYLDVSNFGIPLSYNNCIKNFPNEGTIKMNKNISEIISKFLPEGWVKL